MEDALLSNSTDAPVHDLDFSSLGLALPAGLAVVTEFPEGSAVGLLGMPEDDTDQVLGKVLDAAIISSDARPKVALLDRDHGVVRVFEIDGTPVSSLGGFGDGPGEVRSPVALEYADGAVMILDAALKIERYAWTGAEWEPVGRFRMPMDAQDLCPLEGGLAVLGMPVGGDGRIESSLDGRVVHVLSYPDQEISASLSAPYRYDGILARWYMVRGRLTCNPSRSRVWVAYENLHEIHALDLDGNLLWIARLTDMTTTHMIETERGGIRADIEDGVPVEIISHITLLDESLLAVQVMSALFERPEEGGRRTRTVSYRTYFIDADSGLGVGGLQADHQVIGGGTGRAILYREDPFPQFAVVSIRGG